MFLAERPEDGVDQLPFTHRRIEFDVEFPAGVPQVVEPHSRKVDSGVFLDRLQDGQAAVAGLEVYFVLSDLHLGGAVELEGYLFKHLLDEVHHPDVVLVGDVDLHAGELRVVGLVHAFVAEVLGEFVDAVVAADDEPLEVELVRDPHVEVYVEGVVVGDEGTSCRSSRNRL